MELRRLNGPGLSLTSTFLPKDFTRFAILA
jgi:hypothetical protein